MSSCTERLAGLLLLFGSVAIGFVSGCGGTERDAPPSPNRFRRAPADAPGPGSDAGELELLRRIGYLAGYRPATGPGGVSLHDAAGARAGWNLHVSGHAPAAFLSDMDGRLLHQWRLPYADAFPEADPRRLELDGTRFWRRVHLFPNGDLLAVFDYFGLIRVDAESRLLWALDRPFHHGFHVADGRIVAIAERVGVVPELRPGQRIREDLLVVLDGAGRVLREISLVRALLRSPHRWLLERLPPHDDVFHTNSVQILDGSHPGPSGAFAAGRALVSLRNLHALAVVDLAAERVVWAATGPWRLQHDPVLLPNGRILLFDNLGAGGRSRAVELDPGTLEVVWSFGGEGPEGFRSEGMGAVHRLDNGNTLVVDSFAGRVLEVAPDGRVVWRFDNPARAGERGELVAVVPDLLRVDPAGMAGWRP